MVMLDTDEESHDCLQVHQVCSCQSNISAQEKDIFIEKELQYIITSEESKRINDSSHILNIFSLK